MSIHSRISCDSPIAQIADTLVASTQTLSASDCVLAQPEFIDDSSHVKLFSLQIAANETKTVTVTSDDFPPGFQIYGPAWGVSCRYDYEGCGGGAASVNKSSSESFTITAEGDVSCNNALRTPEHVGPLAALQSPVVSACQFFNFPGQYTVAVGSFYGFRGSSVVLVGQGFSNNLTQYDDIAAGARFRDVSGWEGADWYGRAGDESEHPLTWGRPGWFVLAGLFLATSAATPVGIIV